MMEVKVLIGLLGLTGAIAGWWIFKKIGIKDRPWPDLTRKYQVPTLQGIMLFVLFLAIMYVFYPNYFSDIRFISFVIAGGILVLVAVLDEFRKLPSWFRLFVQILAASVVFFVGGIGFNSILVGDLVIRLPLRVDFILSVVWFLVFVNALNWFDGINGQASWLATLGFFSIALLTKFIVMPAYWEYIKPSELYTLEMIVNIGYVLWVLSFFYFIMEWKPLGLLRDAGVMFLGFALAWLTLLGGGKMGTVLIVLSLVIFDAIWVILSRIFIYKKNPLKGDYYSHLHFRLMNIGWSREEVRAFVLIWSLFFMVLVLLQWTNKVAKLTIFFLMAVLFFGVNWYIFVVKKLDKRGKMYGKEKEN